MKKRIGIDARLYSQTGVGTYLKNFLYYLNKDTAADFEFLIYFTDSDYDRVHFTNRNITKRRAPFHWHSASEQLGFYRLLMKDRLDLVHFTYFSYPVLYRGPFVATVHDLTPLYFKTGRASTLHPLLYEVKYRAFSFILSQQVQHARHIITPSQAVKNEVITQFKNVEKDKITPIYEGVDYELQKTEPNNELSKRYPFSFCVYVGNFYPHKNVENLISAFAHTQTDVKLILVGPEDYFAVRIKNLIEELHQSDRILLHHAGQKKDLVFFYKNALALIHPSLSEGFGLPLVEAMHFNLPIIASDIPVFREILGKNYASFDPFSIESMQIKIDDTLKVQKIESDYSKLQKQYSFFRMTNHILAIYQQNA